MMTFDGIDVCNQWSFGKSSFLSSIYATIQVIVTDYLVISLMIFAIVLHKTLYISIESTIFIKYKMIISSFVN